MFIWICKWRKKRLWASPIPSLVNQVTSLFSSWIVTGWHKKECYCECACICPVPGIPLASDSSTGASVSFCSPASTERLLSLLDLVFIIPPTPFSPGDIWLVLTPWFPGPVPFDPRLLAGPCCSCWFTLGICDWAPLLTCFPWLVSLFSGCIWLVDDVQKFTGRRL